MGKHLQAKMYPKAKVREQIEEADQYDYERISLQSLRAFEWLSLDHFSSSDKTPQSVVRIPASYFPKSPTPGFQASEEETNKTKRAVMGENRKNVRAASAPRPRAVLSSPDNDGILGSKSETRGGLLSALENHNSCQNRHTKCKVLRRDGNFLQTRWRIRYPTRMEEDMEGLFGPD